uniref:Uncharacterized protein n=1 Tax=Arundo donax TaxID=35708 RepID=A0A0A9C2M4_ARUDO
MDNVKHVAGIPNTDSEGESKFDQSSTSFSQVLSTEGITWFRFGLSLDSLTSQATSQLSGSELIFYSQS